jgi:hypothetical protein
MIIMNTCLACKNKTSIERCKLAPITGLAFCGVHARSKKPRIWSVVNDVDKYAVRISKVWRGYRIRRLLKLAGPGVLKRSACHNEEELVLLEDARSVHPLNYFAFEEGGKVWWFDVRSMIGCLNSGLIPTNPYTRQPLGIDTRFRLRMLYKYRINNRLPTVHEAAPRRSINDLIQYQWMRVCQILHENGFEDLHPNTFVSIPSPMTLYYFLILMREELSEIAKTHLKCSRYRRFASIMRREMETFGLVSSPYIQVATSLIIILNDVGDVFPVCAAIVRSFGRL